MRDLTGDLRNLANKETSEARSRSAGMEEFFSFFSGLNTLVKV